MKDLSTKLKPRATAAPKPAAMLMRESFATSRMLDFFSEKELTAQIGHGIRDWPLVALKELMDNALDACEDGHIAPAIEVVMDDSGVAVTDNGPGIPASTVKQVLDFSVRVSSREAYVSPTRGAQGNALKTLVAMPWVLDGAEGRISIAARDVRHEITVRIDHIRQCPMLSHNEREAEFVNNGTSVKVWWPESASSILQDAKRKFLQMAQAYAFLNPHLTLTLRVSGETFQWQAPDPAWVKWRPSDPTSAHWYGQEHLQRLIAAYIAHGYGDRLVCEFVAEFRGLSGTAKQKKVLETSGLARLPLNAVRRGDELDTDLIARLLEAMRAQSTSVKPAALGIIGKDSVRARFQSLGAQMETFKYAKKLGETDGIPWVMETAFAWRPEAEERVLITGVNWSPGILNPFRDLGGFGLDSILTEQRAGTDEEVVLLLHMACARVNYSDRGKSAVVMEG